MIRNWEVMNKEEKTVQSEEPKEGIKWYIYVLIFSGVIVLFLLFWLLTDHFI